MVGCITQLGLEVLYHLVMGFAAACLGMVSAWDQVTRLRLDHWRAMSIAPGLIAL